MKRKIKRNIKVLTIWLFIFISLYLGMPKYNVDTVDNDIKSEVNKEEEIILASLNDDILNSSRSVSMENELITEEINNLENILNNSLCILVNDENKLNEDYEPSNLVEADIPFLDYIECKQLEENTSNAAKEMFDDALNAGINIVATSGYRSYTVQENLYNSRVEKKGVEKTRQYTAEPGASEHQTGLAIDILSEDYPYLDEGFENTDAFKWLINNCCNYGFILRYQRNKEDITGYNYEPWHFRYIGNKEVAQEIMEKGICFEEYITELKGKIEELKSQLH